MVNEELTNYIRDALSKGQDQASLKASLMQVGWQEADIDQVINDSLAPIAPQVEPPAVAPVAPRQSFPMSGNGLTVDSIKPASPVVNNFVNSTESVTSTGSVDPALSQPLEANPIPEQINLAGDPVNNNSTHPTELPPELRGWNWGAFFLSWIWGIFNDVWSSLFFLIPGIGIIVAVVLGIKGNEWAWKKRKFASLEEFKAVQKAWAIWGIILFLISVVALVAFYVIISILKIK